MTHRELLERVHSDELTEWRAYFELEHDERDGGGPADQEGFDFKTLFQSHLRKVKNG